MKNLLTFLLLIMTAFPKVYALTEEDIQFMRANELESTKILLHTDQWGVKPSELDRDNKPYKGQTNSLIDWKYLDPNDWLDIDYWKMTREARDTYADWKIRLRDSSHRETVGKVIQCLGNCTSSRDTGTTPIQTGSVILEGDELVAKEGAVLWVFLVDGSLIRLSSQSSFSVFEINVMDKKIFYNIRLNYGHLYFQHRRIGEYETFDLAETDQSVLPLLLKEANRENFMRQDFQLLTDQDQLNYVLEKNPGHVTQYKHLNQKLNESVEKYSKWQTDVFIFSANASFKLKNPIFHIFYEDMYKTQFYLTDHIEGFKPHELEKRKSAGMLSFRGYRNEKAAQLPIDQWIEVDGKGKTFAKNFSMEDKIKPIDFFVKRIPSLHMAREIYLDKHGKFLLEDFDKEQLAVTYGYRLWDEVKEMKLRLKFLISYVRRAETTNLKSMQKLFQDSLEEHSFDQRYYIRSVKDSIAALKNLRDYDREVVKELTEAEYYLWTMKNGKKFIPTYSR
jgi:hypothetical protein